VTPEELLDLFHATADAVAAAVAAIEHDSIRNRTERPGQYALDVVADDAACAVLERAPVRIVSEESGVRGQPDAPVSVVLDPVDGSTNCARGIAYWATSIAAVEGDEVICALVANHPARSRITAIRGQGAYRDGVRLRASTVTRIEDSVISVAALPERALGWKQYRAFACAALSLCDVAAGGIDGHIDSGWSLFPWDYLGGYLACVEAGATVLEAHGEALVTTDPSVRRRLVAAGTTQLAETLCDAIA
jgi:fructose-1,6-bisphosphatase/inositol monophosphatase family enzyme